MQFDALVVDEAQEFTPAQLEALLWLLPDPEHSPAYLFADPFQHSARFSVGREKRPAMRGRYAWLPPEGMPIVTLIDNVRNSEPISRAVSAFLASQESRARVAGSEPEVITCAPKLVLTEAMHRVRRLLDQDGFSPNQVMVIAAGGFDKDAVMLAARKAKLEPADLPGLMRFPLPAADLRIAVGAPDDAQGLEAEVGVVLYGSELTVAGVRDLYVAASRARSHLVFVGPQTLPQLRSAARAALNSLSDGD